jgi:3-phosphoglycerate kinase
VFILPFTPEQIGNSLFDAPGAEKVGELMKKAKERNVKVVLPVDYITGDKFDKDAKVHFIHSDMWPFLSGQVDWYRNRCRRHSRRLAGS